MKIDCTHSVLVLLIVCLGGCATSSPSTSGKPVSMEPVGTPSRRELSSSPHPPTVPVEPERPVMRPPDPNPMVGPVAVEVAIDEMRADYIAFRYDRVIMKLESLRSQTLEEPEDAAEAYLLGGAAHYMLNNTGHAQAAFEEAARLAPGLRPDPNAFPRKVIDFYHRVAEGKWRADAQTFVEVQKPKEEPRPKLSGVPHVQNQGGHRDRGDIERESDRL